MDNNKQALTIIYESLKKANKQGVYEMEESVQNFQALKVLENFIVESQKPAAKEATKPEDKKGK